MPTMRYRLRTLLIVLAIGLVLLELVILVILGPLDGYVTLPGEMTTWYRLMSLFWIIIPFALTATLLALAITQFALRK